MSDYYVVDLQHFLDEDGMPSVDLHPRALTIVLHLGAIVEWMTVKAADEFELTNVNCRRRPERRRCPGQIIAYFDPDSDVIEWECPCCGDGGSISGWEDTIWDRRTPA
ncbi:MAG: hypothetical protein WBW88_03045 [Rhodothermales bacterium]